MTGGECPHPFNSRSTDPYRSGHVISSEATLHDRSRPTAALAIPAAAAGGFLPRPLLVIPDKRQRRATRRASAANPGPAAQPLTLGPGSPLRCGRDDGWGHGARSRPPWRRPSPTATARPAITVPANMTTTAAGSISAAGKPSASANGGTTITSAIVAATTTPTPWRPATSASPAYGYRGDRQHIASCRARYRSYTRRRTRSWGTMGVGGTVWGRDPTSG